MIVFRHVDMIAERSRIHSMSYSWPATKPAAVPIVLLSKIRIISLYTGLTARNLYSSCGLSTSLRALAFSLLRCLVA